MLKTAKSAVRLFHRYRRKIVQNLDLRLGLLDIPNRRWLNYGTFQPNLILVGAQKAGTTSLAHYLYYHPKIHVSRPIKEPGYLMFSPFLQHYWKDKGKIFPSRNSLLRNGMLENYQWQSYFCDASTYYTMDDYNRDFQIAKQLRTGTKIIYLVRNPYERILSAHLHARRTSDISLKDCLRNPGILKTTLYHKQITPFIDSVGFDNVLLLISEGFFHDPQKTLDSVADFLEIERFTPECGFPTMNKGLGVKEFFSDRLFDEISKPIKQDVRALEKLFGTTIKWDLSRKTWVKKKAISEDI